jgi:hypothetical protein
MNEQVEKLLANTSDETFTTVARGVLDDDSATLVGAPKFAEITTSHNDQRTIGIVKVSGDAKVNSGTKSWSSVVKIIDLSVVVKSTDAGAWVFPEIELLVYENGLFNGESSPLRSAKCYLSDSAHNQLIILWLEDLSNAPQPPWKLEHFVSAANHLGKFNGDLAVNPVELPFEISRDAYYARWDPSVVEGRARDLLEMKDSPVAKQAYPDTPVEVGVEIASLARPLLEHAKSLPHSISFGDSHSRNMFPVGSQTVGIDWASVSNEPTGADIGVLIGSGLTYGVAEAVLIMENEKRIYDSYVKGIQSAGWDGDLNNLRIGFFTQFIGYISTTAAVPAIIDNYQDRREWIKGRFGVELEEVPRQIAPVIATIPGYVEEVKLLLNHSRGTL